MFVVATVVFTVIHLTPGDPALVMLGDEASPDAVEQLREELGLNASLPEQLVRWFLRVITFDLGDSIFLNMPISQAIFEHLGATLLLTSLALVLAVLIGILSGVLAATWHNSFFDQALMFVASLGVAVPNFWLGLMLILFFALKMGLFPVAGYEPLSAGVGLGLKYLFLPALTLAFGQASIIARMTRANMLDVLKNDYIRTAKAKGVSGNRILFKHALKNAMIPTVTVIGLSFANLMGGAVVTEQIFGVPGIGRLLITAVFRRDYPLVQGIVLYVAAAYVLINLLIDILYAWLDPRISYK